MTIIETLKYSKEKKYSEKVIASSQQYLKEFELTPEELSADQRKIVFDFIKLRRAGWIISSVMSITSIAVVISAIFYFKLVADINRDFSARPKTTVTHNDTQTDQKFTELERHVFFIMGILAGSSIYIAGSCIFQIVFWFARIRRKKKVLEAFLPSVKLAVSVIT